MDQVDLVDFAAGGKVARPAARGCNGVEPVARDELAGGGRKRLERGGHRAVELRKVGHRERRLAASAHLDVIVDDLLANVERIHRGIVGKRGEPIGIIPARARFYRLGRDQIIAILLGNQRGFQRRHQARVKADDVELDPAFFERGVDFVQAHATVREQFVISKPGQRAAAVIPENKHVAIRRIFTRAELDEIRQRVRVYHGALANLGV